MKATARLAWLASMTACVALVGCVERRMVITTDPPSAIVYDEQNNPLGAAPVDKPFVYYGKYRFTLVRDGSETTVVEENVKAPWYEWFLLDFISENLLPFTIRDVRRYHYQLQPKQVVPAEAVLQQAQELRARGQTIGVPLPPTPPGPGPATAPLMPTAP